MATGLGTAKPNAWLRRSVLAALLLCMGVASPLMAKGVERAPPAATDTRVQAAIDRIQADDSYQLEIPAPPPPQETRSASSPSPFFYWLGHQGRWLVNMLFVLLIGAAVLFILYLTVPTVREMVERLGARFRRTTSEEVNGEEESWQPDHLAARNLLGEADALARDGHFAEAVHLLLGRSVEDINRRRPGVLKPALTARSITRLGELPAPARSALGRIVEAVERGLWARLPIGAPDWNAARAAYEEFAFGEHWRAGAA